MKKERMLCVLMMGLILNWMLHQEVGAVIYFSAVMTGFLVVGCHVQVDQVFETALLRFVIILSVCLCFSKELKWMEAVGWLMICAASSAFNQRIQKADADFLNQLSMWNMALMPVTLVVVLFCLHGSCVGIDVLIVLLAVFQPSGLAAVRPLDHLGTVK